MQIEGWAKFNGLYFIVFRDPLSRELFSKISLPNSKHNCSDATFSDQKRNKVSITHSKKLYLSHSGI